MVKSMQRHADSNCSLPHGTNGARGRLVVILSVAAAGVLLGVSIAAPLLSLAESATEEPTSSNSPNAVDIGFSQDMAVHHEQAIEMASLAIDSATPELRSLAIGILLTQSKEAGMMRGWLRLWDAPQLPSGPPMSWMSPTQGNGKGAHHDDANPAKPNTEVSMGMATQAELSRLRRRTGAAFDVLFLQLMIRHHQGGVAMAQFTGEHASTPATREAAHTMIATQNKEITLMRAYLAQHNAKPLPAPW